MKKTFLLGTENILSYILEVDFNLSKKFKAQSKYFRKSGSHPRGLKLKCIASISSVYWKSNEKSAESSKHRRTASHMYIAKDDGSSIGYLGDSVSGNVVIRCYDIGSNSNLN